MNERSNDRFEALISAAVVDCVYRTADELCAVDTSAVPDTSRLRKRVMRNLPGQKRTTVKTIIAVALIAAVLALTACACIPEIREYIWRVVTEWKGDHYEVSFEPASVTTEEPETTEPEVQYPTEIEQVAKLTYVPEGYFVESEYSNTAQHIVRYSTDDEQKFVLIQNIYDETKSFMDGKNEGKIFLKINEFDGVVTEVDFQGNIMYCLIWQDDQYRYSLHGYLTSIIELVRIAECVSLE